MNPNTALDIARSAHRALAPQFDSDIELLNQLIDGSIHPDALGELIGHMGALLDGFGALDAWMSKGGVKPAAWTSTVVSSL